MRRVGTVSAMALGLALFATCHVDSDALADAHKSTSSTSLQQSTPGLNGSTLVDLKDLKANPKNYDFFTFRPNLEKLILSGAADTKHISILWYTIPNGRVGLHYHSMTESVYTIDGTQTDAKGVYPTGSLYFNPPGSGHEISDSTGFFILSYASPPDFKKTDLIKDYTPVQINTAAPDLEARYPFKKQQDDVWVYDVPLDPQGGMRSAFIKSTSSKGYTYQGNYLLVLRGHCHINGTTFDPDTLVVANDIEPQSYDIHATKDDPCLVLGVSF